MRPKRYLPLAATFLIATSDFCSGMGSGPHPHIGFGIPPAIRPPPGTSSSPFSLHAAIWLLISVALVAALIWALRQREPKFRAPAQP